jgi:outer membrane immunogenic protein
LGYRGKFHQSRRARARRPATLPLYSQGLNGFLAGGQIGYNYQSGNFLVGVEGDGDWSNIKGTTPCLVVFSCTANMQWTADATIRAGVLPRHNLLVYVKGGASWTSVKYNFTDGGLLAPASITSNQSETKVGGLLGFGTEYMFVRTGPPRSNIIMSTTAATPIPTR